MKAKAGHARAYAALAASLTHYRCPACLDDVSPRVDADGLHCPLCAATDSRRAVIVEQVATKSGFRWVARLAGTREGA